MKNIIIIFLLIIIGLLITKQVSADWERLKDITEHVDRKGIFYDQIEKINCYWIHDGYGVGLSCLKVK